MRVILELLELIDKEVSESQLQNEQFVLDFYDKLNDISVRNEYAPMMKQVYMKHLKCFGHWP